MLLLLPMLGLALLGLFVPMAAQSPDSSITPPKLRLFLDCQYFCDGDYLRTELKLVDWVSDRTASDVHVIASGTSTGSGGQEVTLEFIGRGAMATLHDTVAFQTPPNSSGDEQRREFARVLQLGLVRYLLARDQSSGLALTVAEAPEGEVTAETHDPWKKWVFTVGANAEIEGESSEHSTEVGGDFNAEHTSEEWKIRLGVGGKLDRTTYTLDEGEKFHAQRDRYYTDATVVRSINQHWSVGFTGGYLASKPDNLDSRLRIAPAIEWDLFPYSEVTRRQLIAVYSVGVTRYNYVDLTIYDKLNETLLDHQLKLAFSSQQPWGSARVSGTASSFLHDWAHNQLSISGNLDLRLTRGLSLDVRGSYSRIRDQITLRKGNASDEEILLRLRELETGYRASLNVGLNYRFGSFFNSVVNPRFDALSDYYDFYF